LNIQQGKITEDFKNGPKRVTIQALYAEGDLTLSKETAGGKTQIKIEGTLKIPGGEVKLDNEVIYPYHKVDHL
jgi:hypothetical protein